MPASNTATAPPCETRRASPDGIVVSYGMLSEQHLHGNASKQHSLMIMAERQSEAQLDWQDRKDGDSGVITIRGQHVVFIHNQVDYSLHWKQKAVLIGFYLGNDLSREQETKIISLPNVAHKPLWDMARHDCYIMDMTRLFVEFSHGLRTVYSAGYLEHLGSTLSFHLLGGLARKKKTAPPPTMDADRLHRVLDFIDQNLHGRIEAQTLAKIACLSMTHFNRLFKNTTGMSPGAYILKRRMHLAQALISKGDMKIADVAASAGFCDQSYLDRCFRHFCQCTPKDFARKV